jgi:uncharacterized membrane protein
MLAAFILSAALAASGPGPHADTRGPGANTLHKTLYCVKNAETGACEDCWSDGPVSSDRGTCRLLKSSTTAPFVRKGTCNAPVNRAFCKRKM